MDTKESPKLLVDAMLGRLARWLRLLGYDAEYWGAGSDSALAERARAEGRLILTRDRQLAGRRGVRAVLVQAEGLDEQIKEVRVALASLGAAPLEPRCSECNGILATLSRAAAQPLVPPYVWHTQSSFQQCTQCGRVYWRGTHWPSMQSRLDGEP